MDQLLIGIDWNQTSYDVAILAPNGAILTQFNTPKTTSGFTKFAEKIDEFKLSQADCLIGIETAYNVLIDFLWSKSYSVYVIAPSIVNSSRGRFGNSGAYTDQTDARLIADLLRTDRKRFTPWHPDSKLITAIKTNLSLVDSLTKATTQQANRLRAILTRVYPQILHAFKNLKIGITLHVLMAYPTANALATLTFTDFVQLCRQNSCYRMPLIMNWFGCLKHPQPLSNEDLSEAYESEIALLAQLLLLQINQKQKTIQQVQKLFLQHPDHSIFDSLPGAGDLLAPKLLVMFGDDRERFPSPQDIRSLAGTCPVTKQSGKRKRIRFRHACNRSYRETAHQFAMSSCRQADWAAAYFGTTLSRGHRRNHAYRCLANRWLGIIWKMWQTNQLYDESYHLKQLHKHRRPI